VIDITTSRDLSILTVVTVVEQDTIVRVEGDKSGLGADVRTTDEIVEVPATARGHHVAPEMSMARKTYAEAVKHRPGERPRGKYAIKWSLRMLNYFYMLTSTNYTVISFVVYT
jgi:hypothetical protein